MKTMIKWLCGFTPYYIAVTWFGFDQNETIEYNNQNPAGNYLGKCNEKNTQWTTKHKFC